jgi:histone chaperone ASF1
MQCPPPAISRIPVDDVLGATVVVITCSYRGAEFVRIGYWVSNTYTKPLAESM